MLFQRCMDISQLVYVCFLNINKAFDKVLHNNLRRRLKDEDMHKKDTIIIALLYFNSTADVNLCDELSEEVNIKRGVKQRYVLPPLLFNPYSEDIIQKISLEITIGIKVNGKIVNNIRYANDIIFISE